MGLLASGTRVHVVHEAGCRTTDCRELPIQPAHLHDQRMYPLELRATAEYALDSSFGVGLEVPFRAVTMRVEYTTLDGRPYEPIDAGVHHRDETIAGLADPLLLFRAGTVVQGTWFALRAGVSLPLGKTEENPFELGEQGRWHQHVQLGSGTAEPVLALEAARTVAGLELECFARAQAALYENRHGYRAPFRVQGGGTVGGGLVASLAGALGLEVFHEAAETWDGERRQDASLGRTELLAVGALRERLGRTELHLSARVPLVRHLVEGDEPPGRLSSPLTLGLGVTHVFGG